MKLQLLLTGSETLLIFDDIIADKSLDKRNQSLLEFPISGRHRNHYSWLLTQSYLLVIFSGSLKIQSTHVQVYKMGIPEDLSCSISKYRCAKHQSKL